MQLSPYLPCETLRSDRIQLTFWLFYLNASCNPVIYTIFNGEFRKAFANIMLGKRWKTLKGDESGKGCVAPTMPNFSSVPLLTSK